MRFRLIKYRRFLNTVGIILATSSVPTIWIYYEDRSLRKSLENCLSLSTFQLLTLEEKDFDDSNHQSTITLKPSPEGIQPADNQLFRLLYWDSIKFEYAKRLLNLANNSSTSQLRWRATKALAKLGNLPEVQYSFLANICNPYAAVGLARMAGADSRFFTEPPLHHRKYEHKRVVKAMKRLLINLNKKYDHSCLGYFLQTALMDNQRIDFMFDDLNITRSEISKLIHSSEDIIPLCLSILLHHSTIRGCAKDIAAMDGLPLLMQVYHGFQNNIEICITLCKLISNISMFPETLDSMYKSGWISVLAKWMKNEDFRIAAPAARALANLDRDSKVSATYGRQIYLLHPLYRTEEKAKVDVVFVHGLLGGVFYTWRQRDKSKSALRLMGKQEKEKESLAVCEPPSLKRIMQSSDPNLREYLEEVQQHRKDWHQIGKDFEFVLNDIPCDANKQAIGPYTCTSENSCVASEQPNYYTYCWPRDWLPEDCAHLRIIGIQYDTNLSLWGRICPIKHEKSNLEERSNELFGNLVSAGVGQRPVIWVAHSMGGLLIKNILNKGKKFEEYDKRWEECSAMRIFAAWESGNEDLRNMCLNTKGIVFYSTPHLGSRFANLSQATSLVLWPSVEVQELREDSPALMEINSKFLKLTENIPMKVVSFVETMSTRITPVKFNVMFVEPKSAYPGVGEFFEVPLDHLNICKPANRQSFLYQKVLTMIKEELYKAELNA